MVQKIYQIEFNDGAIFRGNGPVELVEEMKNKSFFTIGKTLEEYMRGYAHRTKMMFGDVSIATHDAMSFILSVATSPECRIFKIYTRKEK